MKKIKIEHRGRICKVPLCKNILSIYNHEQYCHIHHNKLIEDHKPKVLNNIH